MPKKQYSARDNDHTRYADPDDRRRAYSRAWYWRNRDAVRAQKAIYASRPDVLERRRADARAADKLASLRRKLSPTAMAAYREKRHQQYLRRKARKAAQQKERSNAE